MTLFVFVGARHVNVELFVSFDMLFGKNFDLVQSLLMTLLVFFGALYVNVE